MHELRKAVGQEGSWTTKVSHFWLHYIDYNFIYFLSNLEYYVLTSSELGTGNTNPFIKQKQYINI